MKTLGNSTCNVCEHDQLCPTLCEPYGQAPLSMGFSRQEYWSELPFPPSGGLPYPGIEPGLHADSLSTELRGSTGILLIFYTCPCPLSSFFICLPCLAPEFMNLLASS